MISGAAGVCVLSSGKCLFLLRRFRFEFGANGGKVCKLFELGTVDARPLRSSTFSLSAA